MTSKNDETDIKESVNQSHNLNNDLFDGPPPSYEAVSNTNTLERNRNLNSSIMTEQSKNDEYLVAETLNNLMALNMEQQDNHTVYSRTDSQRNNGYTYDIVDDKLDPDFDLMIRHDDYIKSQLQKNYPFKYIILDSSIMIILNVSLIILQVYAINNNAALSYLGSAIWAGLYNLGAVLMALLTIKYRNPTLMLGTTVVKLFGMIISFGGFILVHMVAFYHYNCIAASYYRPCYNKNMINIHYCIIILGIPCLVLSVTFFVYFQIKFIGRFSIGSKPNYNQDETSR